MITSRIVFREVLIFLGICVILFLLNFQTITQGVAAGPFVRVDGGTHIALGQYYSEHIFPNIWGWADRWFGGMPFPQFYPPLFFIFMAVVSKVFFWISYPVLFTGMEFLMLALVPYLLGVFARRMLAEKTGQVLFWPVAISAAFLLSTNVFGPGGITVDSVLTIGLVPQLFGFLMLIGWLFFREKYFALSTFFATIFLAAALLSNVPIAHLALLLMLAFWIGDFTIKSTLLHFKQGLLALLCISVWLFPLLAYYKYAAGVSLEPFYSLISYIKWFPIFAILAWLVYSFILKKRKGSATSADLTIFAFSIVALVTAAFSFINFYTILPSVPVHFYRCFAPAMFLAIIPLFHFAQKRRLLQGAFIFFFFMLWVCSVPSMRNGAPEVFQARRDTPSIASKMTSPGKYLVETVEGGKAMNYFLSSPEYGNPELKSVYNVLIESALSSMFYAPLRSSFGVGDSEVYSGISFLNNDAQFKRQNIDFHIRQAHSMGVKYIVSYSKILTLRLKESKLVEQTTQTPENGWTLFTIKDTPVEKFTPQFAPFLVYDDLNFKKRSIDVRDFTRLGEELLFRNYFPDQGAVPFSLSQNSKIDDENAITEREQFAGVVISNYSYNNLEEAVSSIKKYAETHLVILFPSDDPLYSRISGANVYKIGDLLSTQQGPKYPPLRDEYRALFEIAEKNKQKISGGESKEGYLEISKQSYFPGWKSVDGKPTYIVAPSFTMSSDQLVWQTPAAVRWGILGSVIALAILLSCLFFGLRISAKKKIGANFLKFPKSK